MKHRAGDIQAIKKIIVNNSSLRIGFGWGFESTLIMKEMMDECMANVAPLFNANAGNMTSDMRGDWIGFVPFNIFEQSIFDNMSLYSLIVFNNELINFQVAVVDFILQHKDYRYHAFMRDSYHRYRYMRKIRKDPLALTDAFHYYIDAVRETTGIDTLPRLFAEEMIGCHYLHNPDLFFELVEFYTLKGTLYDE